MKPINLISLLLFLPMSLNAQFEKYYDRVIKSPNLKTEILGGRVQITHLYKQQIRTLYEGRNLDRNAFIEKYVNEVYSPYTSYWNVFFTENKFVNWLNDYWDVLHNPDHPGIRLPFKIDFDSAYISATEKIKLLTQKEPKGEWVLFYGTGGDMGGTDDFMWANFLTLGQNDGGKDFIYNLPHEINHQIYDECNHEALSLLRVIINEGLACYLNYVYWDRKYSPARNIGFTNEEWDYSVKNESRIFDFAKDKLQSNDYDIIARFNKWHCYIWENSPDRLAYFIGFRIIQAYVEKNGKDSWKEIYDLPLSEVMAKSEYLRFLTTE
jgi:hypothetical protein